MSEHHCDIGLVTDGDADRLEVIVDKAEFLHPNKILLLYYYLLRYKGWRGPAMRNVATTHLLDRIAADFGIPVARVSYLDGCKVYFENGGWIIARFSGTEPLLRIFCEMDTEEQAEAISRKWERFLHTS